MAPDQVFVYGTLRNGSDHPMARRLADEGEPRGEAFWRGRLYSLGAYPAAVRDAGHLEVTGDLYRLDPQGALLAALDAYEGLDPGRPDWYVREPHPVRRADGTSTTAWLYRYTGPVRRDAWIPTGDWLAWAATRPLPPE